MPTPILDAIRTMLDLRDVRYRHIHHEPTPTSADAARARGEPIEIGGKALLLKADTEFHLMVLSAACRLDSSAARKHLGVRRVRFATQEELHEATGLEPGGVPPFGRPILPFPLHVDRTVIANERIAFNAGSLTDSIIMSVSDYRRVANIESVTDVARPPNVT